MKEECHQRRVPRFALVGFLSRDPLASVEVSELWAWPCATACRMILLARGRAMFAAGA